MTARLPHLQQVALGKVGASFSVLPICLAYEDNIGLICAFVVQFASVYGIAVV